MIGSLLYQNAAEVSLRPKIMGSYSRVHRELASAGCVQIIVPSIATVSETRFPQPHWLRQDRKLLGRECGDDVGSLHQAIVKPVVNRAELVEDLTSLHGSFEALGGEGIYVQCVIEEGGESQLEIRIVKPSW